MYEVRVEGLRELRQAIKQAEDADLKKALTQANKTGAAVVARTAVGMAPHLTGRLAASIKPLASQTSGRVRAGSARVPYAAAIHWGRKRGNVGRPPGNRKRPNVIQGNPFLVNALQRSRNQVYLEYRKAIDSVVVDALNTVKAR